MLDNQAALSKLLKCDMVYMAYCKTHSNYAVLLPSIWRELSAAGVQSEQNIIKQMTAVGLHAHEIRQADGELWLYSI